VKSSSHASLEILTRLRRASVPVIARIEKDEVLLDVRTLRKGESRFVVRAFREMFSSSTC
jgi:seryl-tRNA(Sec) selenium transferase